MGAGEGVRAAAQGFCLRSRVFFCLQSRGEGSPAGVQGPELLLLPDLDRPLRSVLALRQVPLGHTCGLHSVTVLYRSQTHGTVPYTHGTVPESTHGTVP